MNDAELAAAEADLEDELNQANAHIEKARKLRQIVTDEYRRRQIPATVHHLPRRPAPGGTGD